MPNPIGPTGQSAWPFELLAEPPPEERASFGRRSIKNSQQFATKNNAGSGPPRCRAQPGTASSGGAGRRSTRGCAMSCTTSGSACCPPGGGPTSPPRVLARVLRRLAGDYLAVYGHRVLAVETFTDPARHTGACYAAANFVLLGETLGYARSAGRGGPTGRRQRVWVYLLHRDAPAILAAAYRHPLLAPRVGVDVHTVALAGDSGLLGLLEGLTDPRQKRGIRHRVAAVRTMVAARWRIPRF